MAGSARQPYIPQSVGERIAHARRQLAVFEGRDLGVPEVAERVGVTSTAFYAWEAGEAAPSAKNLERLAAVLGVTKLWLDYGIHPRVLKRASEMSVQPEPEPVAKPASKAPKRKRAT